MIVRSHPPGPPLDRYVECLWYMEGYTPSHSRERALPTGTVEIVVDLGQERPRVFTHDDDRLGLDFSGSVVCGPQSGYFVLDTAREAKVAGVHFRPGGIKPFLGIPAGELTDRHVALDEVWGARARILRERLLEAAGAEEIFARLERALRERLGRPLLPHPTVAYALRQLHADPTLTRVGGVRDDTGYSPKRFIELFRDSVGLTPKLYCRIRRFQAVLESLKRGERVEWAGVAADSGYYDQSHLNREFRAFAGVTPGEYRPVSPDRPSHVAIEENSVQS